MTEKETHRTDVESSRRDFLKLAAVAPAVAAVAAAGGAAEAATEEPSALGLRPTEHVQKYLDSARF